MTILVLAGGRIATMKYPDGTQAAMTLSIRAVSDEKLTGSQLGTVLGKPIYEGDLNKNTSTKDNLLRLILQPLTEDYCRKNGLGRTEELNAKIKDEGHRKIVSMFVFGWELNQHLYEKHGGRVELTAFGNVAFDGMRKWLDEREQARDFELTDPEMKTALKEIYNNVPPGTMFAKPNQTEPLFASANVDRFIEEAGKYPAGAYSNPSKKLVGTVLSQPMHIHERYFANKAELPGLLYHIFIPKLEERYRKNIPRSSRLMLRLTISPLKTKLATSSRQSNSEIRLSQLCHGKGNLILHRRTIPGR
jgi:hypothetical protein